MTFLSGGAGGGYSEKAAKPETTVQDSVSTLGMKPPDISNNTSGHFPVMFVATEPFPPPDTYQVFYVNKPYQMIAA